MAGQRINFPFIKPTAREYSPGEFPQTLFQAQNGASVALKFGNHRVNASLKLTFQNISDLEASRILRCYEMVNGPWDYVSFEATTMNIGFLNPDDYDRRQNSNLYFMSGTTTNRLERAQHRVELPTGYRHSSVPQRRWPHRQTRRPLRLEVSLCLTPSGYFCKPQCLHRELPVYGVPRWGIRLGIINRLAGWLLPITPG